MSILNINAIESPGGILKMEIYKITDVFNCPILITPDNASRIVFYQDNNGLELYPISDEMEIKEPSVLGDGGRTYNISGGFTVKSQNPLVDHKFYAVTDIPVMIKYFFRNGNIRLFGSVVSPLFLSYQPYNGKEIEEGSGYRVTINGKTTQKPVYLNAVTV